MHIQSVVRLDSLITTLHLASFLCVKACLEDGDDTVATRAAYEFNTSELSA
jgi:hypothetical protein